MSPIPSEHELYLLQQELRIQEDLLHHRDQYLKVREQLDQLIAEERERLHMLEQAYHLKSREGGADQITSKKKYIVDLKKKKSEIDHRLDESEELSITDIEAIRLRIIDSILTLSPQQSATLQTLQENVDKQRTALVHLDHLLKIANDLTTCLSRLIDEGLSMRRGGVLRYIMGMNPNLVVIACFNTIQALCTQARPLVDELPVTLQTSLRSALEAIEKKSHEKWRWSTFATSFQALLDRWSTEKVEIMEARIQTAKRCEEAEKSLTQWLFVSPPARNTTH